MFSNGFDRDNSDLGFIIVHHLQQQAVIIRRNANQGLGGMSRKVARARLQGLLQQRESGVGGRPRLPQRLSDGDARIIGRRFPCFYERLNGGRANLS